MLRFLTYALLFVAIITLPTGCQAWPWWGNAYDAIGGGRSFGQQGTLNTDGSINPNMQSDYRSRHLTIGNVFD